jgi:hypothetical protein
MERLNHLLKVMQLISRGTRIQVQVYPVAILLNKRPSFSIAGFLIPFVGRSSSLSGWALGNLGIVLLPQTLRQLMETKPRFVGNQV